MLAVIGSFSGGCMINTKDKSGIVQFIQYTSFQCDACFVLQNPFLLLWSTYFFVSFVVFDYKLGFPPPGNKDRVYPFSWSIVIQSL